MSVKIRVRQECLTYYVLRMSSLFVIIVIRDYNKGLKPLVDMEKSD